MIIECTSHYCWRYNNINIFSFYFCDTSYKEMAVFMFVICFNIRNIRNKLIEKVDLTSVLVVIQIYAIKKQL